MPRINHTSRLFGLLLFTSLLSGCLGGDSAVTKYYILSSTATAQAPTNSNNLNIEVSAVHLPQYLDRPQIVSRTGDNQLKLSELNQWGGNLRKNMIRTLAVNLSKQLNTPNVAIVPHRSSLQADYRIDMEIIKFEADTDNHVHLTAQWRVSTGIERKTIITQITHLSSEQAITVGDYPAIVNEMSQQYAKLSSLIAEKIAQFRIAL